MEISKLPSLVNQVGGQHYKNQHYELAQFSLDVGLNAMIHSAIKYVIRDKGNKEEDLNKAIHCLEIYADWVELESPKFINVPFNTYLDFNKVHEFVSQFDYGIKNALLAILTLQSQCCVHRDVGKDFSIVLEADIKCLKTNLLKAVNDIKDLL